MDTKPLVVLVGGILLGLAMVCQTCVSVTRTDAAAPVVETCIKHPVTRSPLTGRQ